MREGERNGQRDTVKERWRDRGRGKQIERWKERERNREHVRGREQAAELAYMQYSIDLAEKWPGFD